MPLNTVSLVSPVVTSISSVIPENLQRWTYNGLDVAAVTPTGMLDLRNSTTGALSSRSSVGTLGTKIVFYSADTANPSWGFGLQSGRLVGLISSDGAFSIRSSIGGSDLVRLNNDGNISGRYIDSLANSGAYLDIGTGGSGLMVINRVASHIPITVRGAASQTGNLQEWQDSAGAILARVSSAGGIISTANSILSGGLLVQGNYGGSNTMLVTNSQNIIGLSVTGFSTQTANLQEWRNSALTVLSSINPSGFFSTPRINFTGGTSTVSALALADGTLSFESTAGQLFSISNSLTGTIFSVNDISGLPIVEATDLGIVKINELFGQTVFGSGTPTASALTTFVARTAATIPVVVKAATSQSANLQEWHNSTGTILNAIAASGTLVIGGSTVVNSTFGITLNDKSMASWYSANNSNYYTVINFARGNTTGAWMSLGSIGDSSNGIASIAIQNTSSQTVFSVGQTGNVLASIQSPSTVGLIVKGAASQTANLQEWQTSDGTIQLRMTSIGKLFSNYLSSSYGILTGGATYAGGYNFISNPTFATTDVSLIVKAVSSQTSDLQQWQNSSGTVLAKITASGALDATAITVNGAAISTGSASGLSDAFMLMGA